MYQVKKNGKKVVDKVRGTESSAFDCVFSNADEKKPTYGGDAPMRENSPDSETGRMREW